VRARFTAAFSTQDSSAETRLHGWLLFFIALHDLGKFDVRFQLKAPEAVAQAWPQLDPDDVDRPANEISGFDHGAAGYAWFAREWRGLLGLEPADESVRDRWQPWMAAATGHHGELPEDASIRPADGEDYVIAHDREARREWFWSLEELFLTPVGLSLRELPPLCDDLAQRHLVAGFCSVADWLGSDASVFEYEPLGLSLSDYFDRRRQQVRERNLLAERGIVRTVHAYQGVAAVLPPGQVARGVQARIDELEAAPGLLLIEAPTGSGKTEAALAFAWRLLSAGHADSIVFALPTQATANAMLQRLEVVAARLFRDPSANIVLAHGKSRFNPEFARLVAAGATITAQGRDEAAAQCAAWLAQSRKRVFLGQIGVCTVDQVLLSVLPIRHQFVRAFGINKSVLIVDEVHAYDSYMHGLLAEALRRQHIAGGSAILLSATLPSSVRDRLLKVWCPEAQPHSGIAYPLLHHLPCDRMLTYDLPPSLHPPSRSVVTECLPLPRAEPDDALLARVVSAAEAGARIALVMNLVDVAQGLARRLRERTTLPVDLFHARYRFEDRQEKERTVLACYGKNAPRDGGRILIATQVVEQSLDLDFDWMVTQICPADLLFQRLGRLHRHERARPAGHETPRCTVVTVDGQDYGAHETIYGNRRVLWRTEQLLFRCPGGRITFPDAYRMWIELAYRRDDWEDEPEEICLKHDAYLAIERQREHDALRLTTMSMTRFRDEDARATALTRDGEMSLTVLPVTRSGSILLDGRAIEALDERERAEALNLNGIPVPCTWEKLFRDSARDDDGRICLEMQAQGAGGWTAELGKASFRYTSDYGLEKTTHESA
jgi:CRISPR-associated endonuclease/helicase Cas3